VTKLEKKRAEQIYKPEGISELVQSESLTIHNRGKTEASLIQTVFREFFNLVR
jgi:hypothetical protein